MLFLLQGFFLQGKERRTGGEISDPFLEEVILFDGNVGGGGFGDDPGGQGGEEGGGVVDRTFNRRQHSGLKTFIASDNRLFIKIYFDNSKIKK